MNESLENHEMKESMNVYLERLLTDELKKIAIWIEENSDFEFKNKRMRPNILMSLREVDSELLAEAIYEVHNFDFLALSGKDSDDE